MISSLSNDLLFTAQPVRKAPTIPGPPRDPVPASQPRHRPSVKHRATTKAQRPDSGSDGHANMNFMEQLKARQQQNASFMKRQESVHSEYDANMNFLQTPAGGKAKMARESIYGKYLHVQLPSLVKYFKAPLNRSISSELSMRI